MPPAQHNGEDQGVVQERRHLAAPQCARSDHEERNEGDEQWKLLEGEIELERLAEVAGVEHHAKEGAGHEEADGGVYPGEADAGGGTASLRKGEDPGESDNGKHEPVERQVDRQRRVELDRVERNQPNDRQEAGQHPGQQPCGVRPVVIAFRVLSRLGESRPVALACDRERSHRKRAAGRRIGRSQRRTRESRPPAERGRPPVLPRASPIWRRTRTSFLASFWSAARPRR